MILRDYQSECASTVLEWMATRRDPLVVAATGLGKTVIFGSLALGWRDAGLRTLVLAHKIDLIEQTAASICRIDPMAHVGIVQGSRRECHAATVVGSRDSLTKGRWKRLGRIDRVVIDEAHRSACAGYREILAGLRESSPDLRVLGVTATPRRADQQALVAEGLFSGVAFVRDLAWGIEAGWLAPLRGVRIETHTDLSALKTSRRTGDYQDSDLSPLVDTVERNELVVASWREHAADRPTLGFCVDVAHATHLAEAYAHAGVPCAHVSYRGGAIIEPPLAAGSALRVREADRKEIRAASQRGDVCVVTNPMLLGEGSDWPWISCIASVRPISERAISIYAQQVGRGTRLSPETGKTDCLVLDYADNTRHDLSSLADLLDSGAAIEAREKARSAKAEADAQADAEKEAARHKRVGLVVTAREVAILARQTLLPVDGGERGRPLPPARWVDCGPVGGEGIRAVSLDHHGGVLVLYPVGEAYHVALQGRASDKGVLITVGVGRDMKEASADARMRAGAMGLTYTPTAFWRRPAATDRMVTELARAIGRARGLSHWDAMAAAQDLVQGRTCGDVSAWLGYLAAARHWARSEAA